jgi:hypothetical protein
MNANEGVWSSAEPNYEPRPFVAAQVQLIDLTSGSVVALSQTDDKGYYEFPSVGPTCDRGIWMKPLAFAADAGELIFNLWGFQWPSRYLIALGVQNPDRREMVGTAQRRLSSLKTTPVFANFDHG